MCLVLTCIETRDNASEQNSLICGNIYFFYESGWKYFIAFFFRKAILDCYSEGEESDRPLSHLSNTRSSFARGPVGRLYSAPPRQAHRCVGCFIRRPRVQIVCVLFSSSRARAHGLTHLPPKLNGPPRTTIPNTVKKCHFICVRLV
jgi:hypothetical protein